MKIVIGLGNPGPEYDATRHNVGWWLLDRLAYEWDFPVFERDGMAMVTEGTRDGVHYRLLKPRTYMNKSGAVLSSLAQIGDFLPEEDLLIAVDDAALEVGRVRFRAKGSPGGHNGLKSISGALGSHDYARLRIGVGELPTGEDLSDWVLSPMDAGDEDVVLDLLPELVKGVEIWAKEGMEAAMNGFNR
jgi:PTH1 family peptidyl-tRNA hydrolase